MFQTIHSVRIRESLLNHLFKLNFCCSGNKDAAIAITIRLSLDLFDDCNSYGKVIKRSEVISFFNMVDDVHS